MKGFCLPVAYDAGAAKSNGRAVTFKDAEQAIVAALGSVDADFVEAGHIAVHGLPLPSTAESRRGRVCYGLHHGHDHGLDFGGARAQKLKRRRKMRGIVGRVALEEVHAPRGGTLAGVRFASLRPFCLLERNHLDARAQFVEVVRPALHHLATLGQKTVRLYARPLASFTAWASCASDQVDPVAQHFVEERSRRRAEPVPARHRPLDAHAPKAAVTALLLIGRWLLRALGKT